MRRLDNHSQSRRIHNHRCRRQEIPYQLTYDNRIIFPASVKASDKTIYTVMPGTPAPVDTIAWGRQFPERKDDMAWENDRSAYRAYGSALQQSGERAFGYDIWTKSVPHRVLENVSTST